MRQGSAILDFGTAGQFNTDVSTVVMIGTELTLANKVRVFLSADRTTDNDEDAHVMALEMIDVSTDGCIKDGEFTVYGISDGSVTGQFKVRWIWE